MTGYNDNSIFNSLTLMRGIDTDQVMTIQAELGMKMGYPHIYKKEIVRDFRNGIDRLAPLTAYLRKRYLFCLGENGVYCVYSNNVFGSDASLPIIAVSRLQIDVMSAYWNDYEEARKYGDKCIASDLSYEFNLSLRMKTQGDRRRTIGCILAKDGHHDWCWDGELFSFENSSDYIHLKEGAPAGRHILTGFCGLFGWPSPMSPDFPKFIKSCTLYEYESNKQFPERPISGELQQRMMRWPWSMESKS